jgi:hypothetical protein
MFLCQWREAGLPAFVMKTCILFEGFCVESLAEVTLQGTVISLEKPTICTFFGYPWGNTFELVCWAGKRPLYRTS